MRTMVIDHPFSFAELRFPVQLRKTTPPPPQILDIRDWKRAFFTGARAGKIGRGAQNKKQPHLTKTQGFRVEAHVKK